jgi:hypothetical protein
VSALSGVIIFFAFVAALLVYLKAGSDIRAWRLERQRLDLAAKLKKFEELDDKAFHAHQSTMDSYNALKRKYAGVVAELGLLRPED